MKKLFISITSAPVNAQESSEDVPQVLGATITATPSPTPVQVDYQLPYAGLLPDSPLYKLKTLRDRVVSFLISDPLKKAEFDLLQADKRLSASLSLQQQNYPKKELIGETLSKGENYFAEGIEQLNLAKKQGLDISSMTNRFYQGSLKHEQIIQEMEKKAPSSLKPTLEKEAQRVLQFGNQVNPNGVKK
jgi:biotin operon repressor